MPTPEDVRKQAALDLVVSPWTLGPAVLGATALLAGWAAGADPALLLGGIGGVLAGAGVLATRWIAGLETITAAAWEKLTARERAEREADLDALDRELQRDGDPRSQKLLRALRHLRDGLAEDERAGKLGGAGGLLKDRSEEVFAACVAQLRHSLELDATARTLPTRARGELREERQAVLGEVAETVRHLAAAATEARKAPAKRTDGDLARLREELDATLEVARRTEAAVVGAGGRCAGAGIDGRRKGARGEA